MIPSSRQSIPELATQGYPWLSMKPSLSTQTYGTLVAVRKDTTKRKIYNGRYTNTERKIQRIGRYITKNEDIHILFGSTCNDVALSCVVLCCFVSILLCLMLSLSLSCLVLSCLVLSCLVLSCLVLSDGRQRQRHTDKDKHWYNPLVYLCNRTLPKTCSRIRVCPWTWSNPRTCCDTAHKTAHSGRAVPRRHSASSPIPTTLLHLNS